MALPTSGPISIGQIYIEMGQYPVGGWSLAQISNGTYPINPNSPYQPNQTPPYSIGSWHGYDNNASGGSPVDVYYSLSSNPFAVCGGRMGGTLYYDANQSPDLAHATDIFSDSGLSTPFDGQGLYWYMQDSATGMFFSIQIGFNGRVMDVFDCNGGGILGP